MTTNRRPAILFVDDDQHLLNALTRLLHSYCAVTTATSGWMGLTVLEAQGPFAVVVSDMHMPSMSGIEFLKRAKTVAPYSVRVLLTGQADLHNAIDAINEGHIFRFLTKPCRQQVLVGALNAAVEQHRLMISERVLLESTLHGSIRVLTEMLALAQPAAFGRATRAKTDMIDLVAKLGVEDGWLIEIAAMLSQIGCITLPADTAARVYAGQQLGPVDAAMVQRLPSVTAELLGNIPRLEPVRDILSYQDKHFDGDGFPSDRVRADAIPWGARALKISLDFDHLITQGMSVEAALDVMHSRVGRYDPAILRAFADLRGDQSSADQSEEVELDQMRPGMTFAEDVRAPNGALLIARGQEVTVSLASRLRNLGADQVTTTTVRMIRTPTSMRTPPIQRLRQRQAELRDSRRVGHGSA
jgi:response regulator RpfG family c-di-GMP phosphodiesterase